MLRNWGMVPIVIVMSLVGVAAQHESSSAGKATMTDAQNRERHERGPAGDCEARRDHGLA